MEERVRSWFRGAAAAPTPDEHQLQPTSLFANWKAYVTLPSSSSSRAEAEAEAESSPNEMDVEAASASASASVAESLAPFLRSANETLFGTFNIVSKGVRDLPGNVQSAASSFPSGKALMYFGLLLATGIFFIFIALILFLPVMVVMPQKFALSFTLGCLFIILSFFALKGPKTQLRHMVSKERLSFTIGFVGSMAATIYVSMVLHSYLLSVIFSGVQVLALVYY
ncbi:hypothetical protein KI387_006092, partial [Taxus chinensis]